MNEIFYRKVSLFLSLHSENDRYLESSYWCLTQIQSIICRKYWIPGGKKRILAISSQSFGYMSLQDRRLQRDGTGHWRYSFGDSFEFRLIFEFGNRPDAFCHRHRRRDDWRCLSDPTLPASPLKSWLLYLSLCVPPPLSLSLSLCFKWNSKLTESDADFIVLKLRCHDQWEQWN